MIEFGNEMHISKIKDITVDNLNNKNLFEFGILDKDCKLSKLLILCR